MNKIILAGGLSALLLSACSVVGTRSAAVSGQLRGFSANQNLRLALVGYNNGRYTADGTQAQVVDKFLTGGYTLTLPRDVPYGTYRVIVFRDANDDNRYNAGDTVLSSYSGKLLIYAERDNALFNGTKYGWNIYDGNNGHIQTTLLNNYDLQSAN
ncbi:hypothetical protein [Deinococcus sp. Leaf326]|jgi:hypothetical protein|uniref:hypothetical protein n=1 Tax=Deinococcus sp. Leaf326 TaxID=1736338 RepID=UPI0006FFCA39|nr:hypothetical protein [Deinococcus sp. Leaf326]KQR04581.1 hypothetical protein ASF71_11145 [Deinococcus sp. Leaf326]